MSRFLVPDVRQDVEVVDVSQTEAGVITVRMRTVTNRPATLTPAQLEGWKALAKMVASQREMAPWTGDRAGMPNSADPPAS